MPISIIDLAALVDRGPHSKEEHEAQYQRLKDDVAMMRYAWDGDDGDCRAVNTWLNLLETWYGFLMESLPGDDSGPLRMSELVGAEINPFTKGMVEMFQCLLDLSKFRLASQGRKWIGPETLGQAPLRTA